MNRPEVVDRGRAPRARGAKLGSVLAGSRVLGALSRVAPLLRPGMPSPGAAAPYAAWPSGGEARKAPPSLLRRSLAASAAEGVVAEVFAACAGGAVLTGWALFLGCGPLLIALLGALPFLAQPLQFVAAWLCHRRGPKQVALWSVSLSRQAVLPLAALPFLQASSTWKQAALFSVAAASASLSVIGNNAWVAWMGELVPSRIRGRYFGRRSSLCTLGGAASAMVAGALLDRGKGAGRWGEALAALTLVASAAGLVCAALMARQHQPAGGLGGPKPSLSALLEPLRDLKARRFLAYQIAWNMAVGVAAGLFTAHMLGNLAMGFSLVALYGVATAAARVAAAGPWGRAIDAVGARPVLVVCSFGIALLPLAWLWVTPGRLWPIALEALASGSFWCGHALAMLTLPLRVAPRASRGVFLAAFSTGGGLAFAVASATGGLLAHSLPSRFELSGHAFFGLQVVFAASAAARLAAALLSRRVLEERPRPVRELARLLSQSGPWKRLR